MRARIQNCHKVGALSLSVWGRRNKAGRARYSLSILDASLLTEPTAQRAVLWLFQGSLMQLKALEEHLMIMKQPRDLFFVGYL